MSRIAIIGAGAWGTALAIHAARAGHGVVLWARRPEMIGAENPRLPGFVLPREIDVTSTLPCEADAMLLAIPMQHLGSVLSRMRPQAPLLLCCKGLQAETLRLPLEVAAAHFPDVPACVLTGPNFAAGLADGLPTASSVAGRDPELRQKFINLLTTRNFRLYGNDDPIGAQIGGAAKNVIAIAAGALVGAGQGENARAALMTRGLAELARLATALGGRAETVAGLSGLGDLVLTCTGAASRNLRFGLALGRGENLAAMLDASAPVAEGVATAPALVARAAGIDLPICEAVADLLQQRVTLHDAIARLLRRPLKDE